MKRNYDAIIIGAGVVGCSIALSLSRNGYHTLNIDRLPAAGYGSTSHSSAIVRPYYSHPTACAIAHEARDRWLQWAQFILPARPDQLANYRETGGTIIFAEGEEVQIESSVAAMTEIGVEHEIIDAAALKDLFPGIELSGFAPPRRLTDDDFGRTSGRRIAGAVYIPACGYVDDPQLATRNLQQAAQAFGAEFVFQSQVTEILCGANGVTGVSTASHGRLAAPVVVNAAGPHSAQINEMAGIAATMPIRTRALRHEVAYLQRPANHPRQGGFFVDLDTGVYHRPDGDDLLIGSTDPDCDPPDEADPDNYNDQFTEQWTVQAYRAGLRFPNLTIESRARGTVGLYDVSDDWIPIYDRTDMPGLYLAIGTSGNQFKNAPVIGDLMLSIIDHQSHGTDHDRDPAQLHLPHLGRTVDLAFYSRNREVRATRNVLA